jgi:hypothetical protein
MCSGPNEPDVTEADLAFSDVIVSDEILIGFPGIGEAEGERSETATSSRLVGDGSSMPRPLASDDDVLDWYRDEYVPEQKEKGNSPSREDDWQAARQKFGARVRYRQICGKTSARKQFAPSEWSKDGPKGAARKPA